MGRQEGRQVVKGEIMNGLVAARGFRACRAAWLSAVVASALVSSLRACEWDEANGPTTSMGDTEARRWWSPRGTVIGVHGQPVAGATLTYLGATLADPWVTTHTAKTNSEGRFAFSAVIPTDGRLVVAAKGYETKESNANPGVEPRGGSYIVLLRKGWDATSPEENQARDVSRLGQPRTVVGRVVDNSQRPIAGAKLWLPVRRNSERAFVSKGATDEQGRFRLEIPGEWMTERQIDRYLHTIWAYAPSHRIGTAGAYDALLGEDTDSVEVELGPASEISVMVSEPDGGPARGATVRPLSYKRGVFTEFIPRELAEISSAVTDAKGVASLPATSQETLCGVSIEAQEFGLQMGYRYPTIREADPWKIALRPVGRVVGQIAGAPDEDLAGVKLVLWTRLIRSFGGFVEMDTAGAAEITVDEQGRFEIDRIAEGSLAIECSPNRVENRLLRVPTRLKVLTGETTEVTVTAERGVLVEGRIVVKGTGEPLAGAEISVYYGDHNEFESVVSDEDGRFAARVLPGMVRCKLTTIPGRFRQLKDSQKQKTLIPSDLDRFELTAREVVAVRDVSGRLVDTSGNPFPKTWLAAKQPYGPNVRGRTDESGNFFLSPVLTDNALEDLEFIAGTGIGRRSEADILQVDPLVLRIRHELTAETGTIISGRIVDQEGIPVGGERVDLLGRWKEPDGKLVHCAPAITWVRSDLEGFFQTKPVERDREYRAVVSTRTKYNSRGEIVSGKSDWFEASDRNTLFGEVAVERLRSLKGKIVDEDGKPVAFAKVALAGADRPRETVSRADGRFTLYGVLVPGEYRLRVETHEHETCEATIRAGKEHFRSKDDRPVIVLRRP
jgi:hypothetical protein